jgi:hypothetical protein
MPAFDTDDAEGHPLDQIVPHASEEIQPIVANAPDDAIVLPDEQPVDEPAEPVSPGLTPAASSLSAAIRAAAGASVQSDDEAKLLSEAASPGRHDGGDDHDGSLRRTVKALVSPPQGASPSGLGDLGARFRQAAAADSED